MTAYEKPIIDPEEIEQILTAQLGTSPITELMPMTGGNLSRVFSFQHGGRDAVIKFSDLAGAYDTERFVSELLSRHGVPFPRCLGQGQVKELSYSILERVPGAMLIDCTDEQKKAQLPELIRILAQMNEVPVDTTHGYGWIKPDGNGTSPAWMAHIESFYAEDQTGSFWEGWYDLFETTFLEKDIFDECYARLLHYVPFNEPHRHFVHGDFHPWNVMSSGERITGIIDGNYVYGDYLLDLETLVGTLGELDVVAAYQQHVQEKGIVIPNFEERMLGASYFKGLDAMRFYAKMGWEDAYQGLRNTLINLAR
ncbi:phosphotransferase family protein [Paenibacillus albus]|uniref:Aminoglycoside phosphotransferase family protein n=1 Tax=Paenibacillus albus TaxID=2495582 RepID=A0A3Q8X5R9_9BACL|nr:aminoglycoside phosphotransferase family protein [Paenibacillus albus]AZN41165.1 aminoglycoside phosphotransferase family protein [Paenibacillus albus]